MQCIFFWATGPNNWRFWHFSDPRTLCWHVDKIWQKSDKVTGFYGPVSLTVTSLNFDLQYLEKNKCYEGRWPLIRTQIWWRFLWDTVEILNGKNLKNLILSQGPKGLHKFRAKAAAKVAALQLSINIWRYWIFLNDYCWQG